jgi:hypothetical protein
MCEEDDGAAVEQDDDGAGGYDGEEGLEDMVESSREVKLVVVVVPLVFEE